MKEWLASRSSQGRGPPSRPSSQHAKADNLRPEPERRLVTLTFASWNQIAAWLLALDRLRQVRAEPGALLIRFYS